LKTRPKQHTIGIVSLGCAKNLVDTEVMMRQLDANHHQLILDPTDNDSIDTAIINTCGFILDAKNESVDTILQFVEAKKSGRIRYLFVMGCLSQRYRDQLKNEIPEVDDFFGVNELKNIIERIGGTFRTELKGERKLTTPSHYAWLKIAEGCDRKCSFCSIPFIRGNHISRPIEDILKETETLIKSGVRELNIISQDTTYYGLDLYHERKIPELLRNIAKIDGLEWIRLHYTYPDGFPDELMEVINDHEKICKYVDIPLQHINSGILRSMKRGLNGKKTSDLVKKIRREIPEVAIRTSFIVGYPGETEKEFAELKDFISESRFDRLGVFVYSHEDHTAAFRLKDDIPLRIKEKRAAEIMEIQQEISYDLNLRKSGKVLKTVIDRVEGEYYIGRTEFDSPEIDNEVLIPVSQQSLAIGKFYPVKINSCDTYELYGEVADK
jgi:ribosomal protein S12 methylthiotransferase